MSPSATIAVVPVQTLSAAKSRLAARLTPGERHDLVLAMLARVIDALCGAVLIDTVIVVSPDPEVLRDAERCGALGIQQPAPTGDGLNAGVRLGYDAALARGADALLVVLGDLPLLTTEEIDGLVEAGPDRGIVLAPDRHERGTNALLLRPPDAIAPAFGLDSLAAHRAAAAARGLTIREFHSIGTGFDLDTIADLAELETIPRGSHGQAR